MLTSLTHQSDPGRWGKLSDEILGSPQPPDCSNWGFTSPQVLGSQEVEVMPWALVITPMEVLRFLLRTPQMLAQPDVSVGEDYVDILQLHQRVQAAQLQQLRICSSHSWECSHTILITTKINLAPSSGAFSGTAHISLNNKKQKYKKKRGNSVL